MKHLTKTIIGLLAAGSLAVCLLVGCAKEGDTPPPPASVPPAPSAPAADASGTGVKDGAAGGVVLFEGSPSGLLLDGGSLVVSDLYNKSVWKLPAAGGRADVLAGREGVPDVNNEPIGGYNDADNAGSAFGAPWALAEFMGGYAVSDTENHVVRIVIGGRVYTVAGTGSPGLQNGSGVAASFHSPTGLARGDDGSLYVADTGNHVVRRIDTNGGVTTYAGAGEGRADGPAGQAKFRSPTGLCWAGGRLYVADSGNHRICVVEDGSVSTLAGSADFASEEERQHGALADGRAEEAKFSSPQGVAVAADGAVYVADTGNSAIRAIVDGGVETLLQGADSETFPVWPRGILADGDALYVADPFAGAVYRMNRP